MGNTCSGIREPCLSDVDPRFDPDAKYGLIEQNPIWQRNAGLFELVGKTYAGNGTEIGLQDVGSNLILDMSNIVQYANVTIDDTRLNFITHMFIKNGYGNEYSGYAQKIEVYGYSTHELDGRMVTLPDYDDPTGANSVTYVVGKDTTFATSSVTVNPATGDEEYGTISRTCLDTDCMSSTEVHQNFIGGTLYNFRVYTARKFRSTEEFLKAKEATEADTNVNPFFLEGLNVPPGTFYPSPDSWCVEDRDPSCIESPYVNPVTPVRAEFLAIFVICGAVLAFIVFFALYKYMSKKQEKRMRTLFARRVAETITIRSSAEQLTPDELQAEFQTIDDNNDGYVQKSELWNFLESGKIGQIRKSDFDLLWTCMDVDDSGKVDFLEFCAYMGKCHEEYDNTRNRRSVIASRASQILAEPPLEGVEDFEDN